MEQSIEQRYFVLRVYNSRVVEHYSTSSIEQYIYIGMYIYTYTAVHNTGIGIGIGSGSGGTALARERATIYSTLGYSLHTYIAESILISRRLMNVIFRDG